MASAAASSAQIAHPQQKVSNLTYSSPILRMSMKLNTNFRVTLNVWYYHRLDSAICAVRLNEVTDQRPLLDAPNMPP
jgi:hypothetical protein